MHKSRPVLYLRCVNDSFLFFLKMRFLAPYQTTKSVFLTSFDDNYISCFLNESEHLLQKEDCCCCFFVILRPR